MNVSAVITLASPLSRSGSDRWGQFIRQSGERNHWWLGRKLTPEEFNAEFPKAVRFAGPDRPLVGLIFVEESRVTDAPQPTSLAFGEDTSSKPLADEAHLAAAQEQMDAKIADIQAGVNDWQAAQNAKLAEALAQIEQLEAAKRQAESKLVELETKLSEQTTTISQEPVDELASQGSEPDSSGATGQALPKSPPVPATPAKPKGKKK